ncbi:MAG: HAD hydrolase-like protein [Rhodospirillum sp.]|nr:HAD hydrolase-like protein [Rhodospirillum sp.]MCF8490940.1 HAD hydrolase-like protein [Rhodospirillum sp.]MCF8502638.1 HAD hydrolase-like protein [Rhodospirillum sp.]
MPDRPRGTVILDLDGTLVDSAPDLADTLDLFLATMNLPPLGLEATRQRIGHGIHHLVAEGLAAQGVTLDPVSLSGAVDGFLKIYAGRLSAKTRPYEGAADALASLRLTGWRLVVCTNKLEASARGILQDLGLMWAFALIAGPDTFGVAKPDPAHLLRTLPEDRPPSYPVVMVSDSTIDVDAARAARIPVIAVTWGYSRIAAADMGADRVAGSFGAIPGMVEELAGTVSAA